MVPQPRRIRQSSRSLRLPPRLAAKSIHIPSDLGQHQQNHMGGEPQNVPKSGGWTAAERSGRFSAVGQIIGLHYAQPRHGLFPENHHRYFLGLRPRPQRQRYIFPNDPESDLPRPLVQLRAQASHFTGVRPTGRVLRSARRNVLDCAQKYADLFAAQFFGVCLQRSGGSTDGVPEIGVVYEVG